MYNADIKSFISTIVQSEYPAESEVFNSFHDLFAEKIEEGNNNDQRQSDQKSQYQQGNFPIGHQFFVPLKFHCPEKIKEQEDERNNHIVNAIF